MTDEDLENAVREDIRCHRENGVDLNPFSTLSSRWSWQRGFDGEPLDLTCYAGAYRRGQMAAKLIKEQ